MQAIILAAGVARRLTSLDGKTPKCLLQFKGKSLLNRHLQNLEMLGVSPVTIVVGHLPAMIAEEVGRCQHYIEVRQALNEHYKRGSILSLKTGLEALPKQDDVIIMDADVLYHPHVLSRLVKAPFANGFLLDTRSEAAGEEMMLGVRDGKVGTISRRAGKDWELLGEGVGFFRLCATDIPVLLEVIRSMVARDELDADYEQALDLFLKQRPAHFVSVADLPWTEIDFDADVIKANDLVLPAIEEAMQAIKQAPGARGSV